MVLLIVGTIFGAAGGFSLGWMLRNQAHAEVLDAMERRLRNAQRGRQQAEEQLVVRRAQSDASMALMRSAWERHRASSAPPRLN